MALGRTGLYISRVSDFLDVPGASGAHYRFRLASPDDLPAQAGNLIAITGDPAQPRVRLCATSPSLAQARGHLAKALKAAPDARLFVRLNVARAIREAEHADIVSAVNPEVVVADLG